MSSTETTVAYNEDGSVRWLEEVTGYSEAEYRQLFERILERRWTDVLYPPSSPVEVSVDGTPVQGYVETRRHRLWWGDLDTQALYIEKWPRQGRRLRRLWREYEVVVVDETPPEMSYVNIVYSVEL